MGESGLEKINTLLDELNNKVLIRKRAEILTGLLNHYEVSSNIFFTEENDVVDISRFVEEAKDNDKRKVQQKSTLIFNALQLLFPVVRDICKNLETLEDQYDNIFKCFFLLLKTEVIKEKDQALTTLSDLILSMMDAIELNAIDLWLLSWNFFKSSSLNSQICWNSLRIVTKMLQNLQKTIISLELEKYLREALEILFDSIKKRRNENWPHRLHSSILSFLVNFMDNFGLLFREEIVENLFSLENFFISTLKVVPNEENILEIEWHFLDRLTSLAIPDCRKTSLVTEKIFGVVFAVAEALISDLVDKSITSTHHFKLIPEYKIPLFAKLLVIIDQDFDDFQAKVEPGPSKRTKVNSLLEIFYNDFLYKRLPEQTVHPANVLLILEEIIAKWGNRLSSLKLNSIVEIVLKLDKKLQSENSDNYCRVVTALIRRGALGNSVKVKSEAAMANPMQDPRITVKVLWKLAISSSHNSSSSDSAIDLMMELIKNFKEVLIPEDEDDQLVETICSVLIAQTTKKSLELLSLLLTKLEFDEVKPFPGAENKESGLKGWNFRCQIAEHLISKVPEDISLQLFQLSTYHPQPEVKKRLIPPENELETNLRYCYLLEEQAKINEDKPDAQLGACLNHEIVDYISQLLLDQFIKNEHRFTLFTSALSYCSHLEATTKVRRSNEVISFVEPLIQTINEWLQSLFEFSSELERLDPGIGCQFISNSNRKMFSEISWQYLPPILFARFPFAKEVPPSKMKQFLNDSIKIIQKYDDFLVPFPDVQIKEEPGESDHRFHHNKTVGSSNIQMNTFQLPFSTFLSNYLVQFIEENISFLPDVVTLMESGRPILRIEDFKRITEGKANKIIKEDMEIDSAKTTTLKRKMCLMAIYPHLQLISHTSTEEFENNSLALLDLEGLIVSKFYKSSSASPLIKQSLIRRYLANTKGIDVDFFQIEPNFRKLLVELNPEYLDHLNEREMIKKSFLAWKENKINGLNQFKNLMLNDQNQIHLLLNLLKTILTKDRDLESNHLLAMMSIVIAVKGNREIREDILTTLMDRLADNHEAMQLISEALSFSNCLESDICQGVIDKWLNGGELEMIGFSLTKIFWKKLKNSLNSAAVVQLEKQRIFLYDYILIFWDALPSMRKEIIDVLGFFNQSRESAVRRGSYSIDGMRKLAKEFCLLRVMDPVGNKDELGASLRILDYLEKKGENNLSQKKSSQEDAFFGGIFRQIGDLDPEDREFCLFLRSNWSSIPTLITVLLPFINALSKNCLPLLNHVKDLERQNAEVANREIRTFAEVVDAVGLEQLALSEEEDGNSFLPLGRILLFGGYVDHAFAIANIAFDRFLKEKRNLAGFKGPFPNDKELWQLLGSIYLRSENWQALDSIPRQMQDDINVQLLRAVNSCQWLQVIHSPVASKEQKIKAEWYCGFDSQPKGNLIKYTKGLTWGDWDLGYPKRLDTHHKRLFALIKNQNHCSNLLASKIREMYIEELETNSEIPAFLCNELYDFEILTKQQISSGFLKSLSLERLSFLMWKMYRHCKYIGGPDATLSFSDFSDCFQVSGHLLLSKLKDKKAFIAALSILSVLKSVVDDKLGALRLAVKECEIHVEMGNHLLAENRLHALSREINLQGEDSQMNEEEVDVGIEVICLLSKIQAEYSSKNVEQAMIPLKALNNCNMTNDRAVQHVYSIALRQLQEIEAFMESPMIKLRKEARESHRRELQHMRNLGIPNTPEDQKRQKIINKEYSCESEELSRLERKLEKAACFAVQAAVELLEFMCNGMEKKDPVPEKLKNKTLRIIFPLIDLIFRYEKNANVVTIFKSNISSFPFSVWLPAVPHLMPHCFRQGPLSDGINTLIVQLIVAYPFHTVPTLLSYKFKQHNPSPMKAGQVDSLLEKAIRAENSLEAVVKDLKEAHRIYREFVWLPLKQRELAREFKSVYVKGKEKYKISDDCCIISKLQLLRRVPIPTVSQPVGQAKDYRRDQLILWAHVDPHCDKADGNSSPKILRVKGSNGVSYKMVWKDGESVRQDSLVQDLFSVISGILDTDQPLRTYNVVPLDSHSGIIEFCEGTHSIKDILIGPDSRGGLHHEIYPNEEAHAVRKKMNQIQLNQRTIISVEKFKEFCREITPAFRHHFYRNFPHVHDWNTMIKRYTRSLAQWSIVTYVIGLGDRHGSNVLFEPQTSNFIHIDLGMILEFSQRMLPIPEVVPFRLTRDLLDPILVQGIKGNLAYEAADALEKIRTNKDVILGVTSVFLRETVSNFNDTADDKQRSFAMETALGRLQAKLNGTDVTISPVSAMDQAKRLLDEATDLENISKLFAGWLAII